MYAYLVTLLFAFIWAGFLNTDKEIGRYCSIAACYGLIGFLITLIILFLIES